jgi:hypothetical protein
MRRLIFTSAEQIKKNDLLVIGKTEWLVTAEPVEDQGKIKVPVTAPGHKPETKLFGLYDQMRVMREKE